MAGPLEAPHLPRPAPIDGYGKGGFRFAGMSHRGSLLCLPSGIWAWPVNAASEISEASLAQVFAEASEIGLFLLGTGVEPADDRTGFAPPLFGSANSRLRSCAPRTPPIPITSCWVKAGASLPR